MKYVIDKKNRPVYIQLYKQIKDDITTGNYPYHSKLPSKRGLAEEVGVSVITVEHAYALLCDEGYVEARERSGYIVIFRKTDGFVNSSENHVVPISHQSGHDYPDFPLSVLSKAIQSDASNGCRSGLRRHFDDLRR